MKTKLTEPTKAQIKYRNRKWAEALMTSKKCKKQLARGSTRCCLGVAQDVAVQLGLDVHLAKAIASEEWPETPVYYFFGWDTRCMLCLPNGESESAAVLNDGDDSFQELPHKKIAECVLNTFVRPKNPKWSFKL